MGFKRLRKTDGIYEPNMTPLIDVCLVLVVILLVATPMALQSSIMVQKTAKGGRSVAPRMRVDRVEITVTSSDSLLVNRRPIAREEFQATVGPLIQESATRSVAVRCRPEVTHGTFVGVLDELKQLGAGSIAVQGR